MSYQDGWDDCLDVMASIIHKVDSLEKLKEKVEYLHVLVKEKKFDKIKTELGILQRLF